MAPAREPAGPAKPLRVDVQMATRRGDVPGVASLRRWAQAAHLAGLASLSDRRRRALTAAPGRAPIVALRIVAGAESQRLNHAYRGKDKPTNVLSFPASADERLLEGALGDLVICAPVVAREAREQGKRPTAHWAHMLVHGTLHLLGFDHERPRAARAMESLEVEILRGLGFDDPYRWSPRKPHE
jgi:probable rRNA maturation factor